MNQTKDVGVPTLAQDISEGQRHDEKADNHVENVEVGNERASNVVQHQLMTRNN